MEVVWAGGHREQHVRQEFGVTATAYPKRQRLCVALDRPSRALGSEAELGMEVEAPRGARAAEGTVVMVWRGAEPGEGRAAGRPAGTG